jgi:hypothetical protein
MTGFHMGADALADGAEPRVPLDERIDGVVIEGNDRKVRLVFGFEYDSFGPRSLEDFADGRFRITQSVICHFDSLIGFCQSLGRVNIG